MDENKTNEPAATEQPASTPDTTPAVPPTSAPGAPATSPAGGGSKKAMWMWVVIGLAVIAVLWWLVF